MRLQRVQPRPDEYADFDVRFRHDRLRRWLDGRRRGLSLASLARFRLGSRQLAFHGVIVETHAEASTYRLIEDIWMRGEYDVPGFIPQPGWRVVDIGANVGIFSMLAASRGAHVVAFEPDPRCFKRLESHTASWEVECHRAAVVARETDHVALHLAESDTRNAVVEDGTTATAVVVPAMHIRDVLAEPCDLLKMDCEGAEFELLAGAGDRLRHAARIIAEVHLDCGPLETVLSTLERNGFDSTTQGAVPGLEFVQVCARRRPD